MKFFSLNGIATVYTMPDDEYALALGGVADFGGMIQAGWTYHLGTKSGSIVIGCALT